MSEQQINRLLEFYVLHMIPQDALGVQIGGQQQEEAQEDRDVEVAPGAHLQKHQPQKEHHQRYYL